MWVTLEDILWLCEVVFVMCCGPNRSYCLQWPIIWESTTMRGKGGKKKKKNYGLYPLSGVKRLLYGLCFWERSNKSVPFLMWRNYTFNLSWNEKSLLTWLSFWLYCFVIKTSTSLKKQDGYYLIAWSSAVQILIFEKTVLNFLWLGGSPLSNKISFQLLNQA